MLGVRKKMMERYGVKSEYRGEESPKHGIVDKREVGETIPA
jgi:hypothetical protein